MKSKVLIIEDNKTKSNDIKSFLLKIDSELEITIKESLTSGLRDLFSNDYQVLLLDMSLPTREGAMSNTINNFEQLGGHRILSEMKRKKKQLPTILITMFSEFGVGESFLDINNLDIIMKSSFNDFYKGLVFYSSQNDDWKKKLHNYLKAIL
ncbi:response regulator [Empedobacter falsenii]